MKKMTPTLAFISILLAAGAAAAGPGTVPGWPAEGRVVPGRPAEQAAEVRRAAALAELYGTTPEMVSSLRALGLEWIETECVVAVSTHSSRSVQEVLDLRGAGMEWGEIAGGYGFMLKDAVRDAPARKRRTARPGRESSRP